MLRMRANANTCLAALLFALLHSGCGRVSVPALPPPVEPVQPTLSELQPRVDKLLALKDAVKIRRNVADIFALVDLLLAENRQEEAATYLSAALTHNAWALEYQMKYAELAEQRGEFDIARQKATLVLEFAEQDELVLRAQSLLGLAPLSPMAPIQRIMANTTTLVLVPIGNVDRCVLYELGGEIGNALSVPVIVCDAGANVPPAARDPVARYINTVRTNLTSAMKDDPVLALFLKQRGLTEASLQETDAVIEACRQLSFRGGNTNALSQFDARLRELRQESRQWDINKLLRSLKVYVRQYVNRHTYFIGVTRLDTFADQNNFIFGTAENNGRHAVISYHRFTAAFSGDSPSRKRLVERAFKQVLSSFGFMLGVPRCSTPTCARAYPHSLAEHDAKSKDLCPACRAGFEQAFGLSGEDKPYTRP